MTKTETKKLLDIEHHRMMLRQMLNNILCRSVDGQHMSDDDDLYRACRTNTINKRIHGYIVVHASKNLVEKKSLRYEMMVLDEFTMLDGEFLWYLE